MSSTPLMQQYRDIKSRHQDAILFFRMGEFYEMFYDDAETASRALGLTLTTRNNGAAAEVPLAGVPVKAAADYVRRLVQQGFRVAICEQVEDPKVAKGIVRREVIETVTPGVALADDLLEGARNNYVVALASGTGDKDRGTRTGEGGRGAAIGTRDEGTWGVAAADVSTGEMRVAVVDRPGLDSLLARLSPREIVIADDPGALPSCLITEREQWEFDPELARDDLTRHFGVLSLDGLGLGSDDTIAIGAAGALLRYLKELQPAGVSLARPIVERAAGVLPLDEMTRRNLELVESLRPSALGGTAGTLIDVLDRTATPMGARLLRQWLLAPLADKTAIDARLDAVDCFAKAPIARETLRTALGGVRDIERLGTKAALGRSTPRELGALGISLSRLPAVRASLDDATSAHDGGAVLRDVLRTWDDCGDMCAELAR